MKEFIEKSTAVLIAILFFGVILLWTASNQLRLFIMQKLSEWLS